MWLKFLIISTCIHFYSSSIFMLLSLVYLHNARAPSQPAAPEKLSLQKKKKTLKTNKWQLPVWNVGLTMVWGSLQFHWLGWSYFFEFQALLVNKKSSRNIHQRDRAFGLRNKRFTYQHTSQGREEIKYKCNKTVRGRIYTLCWHGYKMLVKIKLILKIKGKSIFKATAGNS